MRPGSVDVLILYEEKFIRFPTVAGSNLERTQFVLPRDLPGDLNLLILAFWQHHQALVDTWMPLAAQLEEENEGLVTFELPVIQSRSRLSQWFIDSGMRAGIPDRRVRERTITIYLDKAPFLDDLSITDDGTIYSLLVDRSGEVLWRASGPLDPGNEAELKLFLQERRTRMG